MTGKCKTWDIWLANVKFEDSDEIKQRPVVIINHTAFILCLKVTSNITREECGGNYLIRNWRETGLEMPSVVMLDKAIKIENGDLNKRIGTLHPNDVLLIQHRLIPR
jgi:PemK-like protein.